MIKCYGFYWFFVVLNVFLVILELSSIILMIIRFKWLEVKDFNLVLFFGYVIVYKEIDKKFYVNVMKLVVFVFCEVILEDLKKFINYIICVYVFMRNGNGVLSDVIFLRIWYVVFIFCKSIYVYGIVGKFF